MDLRAFLRTKQALVEDRLDAFLRKETAVPGELAEAMRYSLMAPGKRLRPMLVIMAAEAAGAEAAAAEAAGGRDEVALPAACAVEMIHTYSLIHDDLPAMDDDDLRRGQPTCHKQFGEALAILAGDALLTMAFQVLAECYPPATACGCCRELARGAGAAGMVGGQVEDLAWESHVWESEPDLQAKTEHGVAAVAMAKPRSLSVLENIHALKTGALFRACLRLGVWSAQGERPGGPDPDILARLDKYGRCFGMVFQITDDLLDVEGNAADTGKRVQKDAVRGKLTYPGFLGIAESRSQARRLAQDATECLRPLSPGGERLAELLRFVVERDR